MCIVWITRRAEVGIAVGGVHAELMHRSFADTDCPGIEPLLHAEAGGIVFVREVEL